MKRKVKKYADEGLVKYDKEDEGLFGGKVKYREDSEGRKYTKAPSNFNPYARNPEENRYYSKDDIKKGLSDVGDKISNFFGGKKEDSSSKFDELESVGRRPRTIEEQIGRKAEDKGIASNFKSSEPKFERNDNEKSMPDVKKAAPRKAPPKQEKDAEYVRKAANDALKEAAPEPKKAKVEKDEKPTPLPAKAEDKKPVGKDATPMKKEEPAKKGFSTRMGKTPEEREAQAKANREAVADTFSGITKYFRNPFAEDREEKKDKPFVRKLNTKPTADQMKKMARGGSVKSSASSRGDGCAVRGKTKGRIY